MEFELEERSAQMGDDDALDMADERSPQRDRRRFSRPSQMPTPNQDQALFIPEQEAGIG